MCNFATRCKQGVELRQVWRWCNQCVAINMPYNITLTCHLICHFCQSDSTDRLLSVPRPSVLWCLSFSPIPPILGYTLVVPFVSFEYPSSLTFHPFTAIIREALLFLVAAIYALYDPCHKEFCGGRLHLSPSVCCQSCQFGPLRVISDITIISLHMGKVHNWLYEYFPRVHRILL